MRKSIATETQIEVANQALPNLINAIQKNKDLTIVFARSFISMEMTSIWKASSVIIVRSRLCKSELHRFL